MAVTPYAWDLPGTAIAAKLTALQAANNSDPQSTAANAVAVAKAQAALVTHLLQVGRLSAASTLQALSLSAANLPSTPAYSVQGTNLANRITSLTTAAATAGPSQSDAAQRLQAAYEELLGELIVNHKTSHALILAANL